MKKYQQKINEVGGLENLSKGIKSMVRDYENAEKQVAELRESLEEAESDEERAAIQADIEEIVVLQNAADEELVKKIDSYMRNKDGYDARMKMMRERKDAALAAQGKPPVQYKEKKVAKVEPAPADPAPAPAPAPAATEVIISKAGGGETTVVTPTVVEEKKEEKGLGSLLLWGALGVAGIFIGVNLFKNRN